MDDEITRESNRNPLSSGMTFGQWTLLEPSRTQQNTASAWRCRCSCGKEEDVPESALLDGSSSSCGCKKTALRGTRKRLDLTGKVFGDLTVLDRDDQKHNHGGVWWKTRCTCGAEYTVPGTLLVNGRRTHCGCKAGPRGQHRDITGERFGRLTAVGPTKERDKKGYVIWHCKCDCGNEIDVSYNLLCYSMTKSCGCQKLAHNKELSSYLNRVDGTSVDRLRSSKIPVNNTTGYQGVYFSRGKYIAKIVIQKKQYQLGSFHCVEDAAEARRIAEDHIRDTILPHFVRWQKCSQEDPEWAKKNPIKIVVEKDFANMLKITCYPRLPDNDPVGVPAESDRIQRPVKGISGIQRKQPPRNEALR